MHKTLVHSRNLSALASLEAKIKPVVEKSPFRPTSIVSKYHVDRVYKSVVDGTWHLEDSDSERVQNPRHPQHPGEKVNFNNHFLKLEHHTGTGVTTRKLEPSAPVEDRNEYNRVNREIHQAQFNARLIANSDLPKRNMKRVRVNAHTLAIGVRQVLWNGEWVSYECEGFVNG